jgi:hypothetical protein
MSKTFNRVFFRVAVGAMATLVFGTTCLLSPASIAAEPAPAAANASSAVDDGLSAVERQFLTPPVQVTVGMPKAGEGYFSSDSRRICYQAVPADYPFYQIFVQPFDAAAPRPAMPVRISTGRGRTTCSWFSPDGTRLLFASSHLDPQLDATESAARAQAEEDRKTGRRRRYQWDFDPHTDIFVTSLQPAAGEGNGLVQLTHEPGYDAECSFSPDGSQILFVSDRDGDPDIYVMDADGRNVRQLTNEPGYDGGPFFSPDGRFIAYRTDRLEKDMLQIHVMKADGSGDRPITSGHASSAGVSVECSGGPGSPGGRRPRRGRGGRVRRRGSSSRLLASASSAPLQKTDRIDGFPEQDRSANLHATPGAQRSFSPERTSGHYTLLCLHRRYQRKEFVSD